MRLAALVFALLTLAAGAGDAPAAATLRVVTTTTDLKALTEAVGGAVVEVESLTRGTQNVHDVELRPSLMLKLRRADVLVENGLELDAWIDVAARGASNAKILAGGRGRIDASRDVPVIDVPAGRVDRSHGDVHPQGNPHFSLDPGLAPLVTQTILEGLARVAPAHQAVFAKNRDAFLARLADALAQWTRRMEPFKGAKVVSYHADFNYFLRRFGLVPLANLEDRPGIPPSPGHLARLIQQMKQERVKVVLLEPWSDRGLAERVAGDAGARAIVLATGVGAVTGAETYLGALEYNVRALTEALR
ncbi:MAG: zinc ABC transporter substrate-binding protein [Candidatus Rokubacteria bacterium]|nr:zinc ABC transporter substrate-binding protein [Candidatus Rokubacteria bacterium]